MKSPNEKLIDSIAKAMKESDLLRPPMSLGLPPARFNAKLRAAIAKGLELDSGHERGAPAGVKL